MEQIDLFEIIDKPPELLDYINNTKESDVRKISIYQLVCDIQQNNSINK